jgi:integrase
MNGERQVRVWVQRFADRDALVLQWHDPDTGKRRSRSADTTNPIVAERKRIDLEYELNHGLYSHASHMSWKRFREVFEAEYLPDLREGTCRNFRATFDLFEDVCRPGKIRGITERTVSVFAAGLRRRPGHGKDTLQASTVKVRLQFLRTALNWAVVQKILPACPRFPAVKVPQKKPQPVPSESFERMVEKASDANMRAFIMCGWLAGLRLCEAMFLEWEETDKAPYLDLANNRIVLPAGFVKGATDQWVPLDPALRQAIGSLQRSGSRVFRFVARNGRPVGAIAVSHRVTELARTAGVRLTMKSLRRGFGCRYAGRVPAQVLQKLMRHGNIKVTMDYYANVDDAVFEAVLGPQRNTLRNSGTPTAGRARREFDTEPSRTETSV